MKFNHLTAIRRVYGYANNKAIYWEFKCDCQSERTTIAIKSHVMRGCIKSCGCLTKISCAKNAKKHGGSKTRLYEVWYDIKRRCYNKKRADYKNYGGRGIEVCSEWLGKNGFENFREWAYANGYDENAPYGKCTIDRIDNNSGYSPQNCRWIDMVCQANNRRTNHRIDAFGENHTLAEWARKYDIDEDLLWKYIKHDCIEPEKAIMKCKIWRDKKCEQTVA